MTTAKVYVDGQFFASFDTAQDAENIKYWMGEGQTMCIVEDES